MFLLLGGCGFIGRSLAVYLVNRGHSVKIFDRPENIARWRNQISSAVYQSGNFTDIRYDDALFHDVTAVVHLVHSTIPAVSMEDISFDAESNIVPSIRLLNALSQHGIRRIIYFSSGGTVYGAPQRLPVSEDHPTNPQSAYGISKLAIEKYVQLYTREQGIEGIIVRPANPYGPHQLVGTAIGAIANFLLRVSRSETVEIWGDGTTVRDYIYIDDVVDAIERLLVQSDVTAGVYNLGSGQAYNLHHVLKVIHEVSGIEPVVRFYPQRTIDVPAIVLDSSRLQREINWRPQIPISEGIRRLWSELIES